MCYVAHLSSIVDGELRAEHVGPQFSDEWVSTCNKDTSDKAATSPASTALFHNTWIWI